MQQILHSVEKGNKASILFQKLQSCNYWFDPQVVVQTLKTKTTEKE